MTFIAALIALEFKKSDGKMSLFIQGKLCVLLQEFASRYPLFPGQAKNIVWFYDDAVGGSEVFAAFVCSLASEFKTIKRAEEFFVYHSLAFAGGLIILCESIHF